MRILSFVSCVCVLLALAKPLESAAPIKPYSYAEKIQDDLTFIKNTLEVCYAPAQWKKEYCNWDLDASYSESISRLNHLASDLPLYYQRELLRFLNQTQDYHVGINYYATERASLPFTVKGANGRYFITYVDRDVLMYGMYPFNVGDELLLFDGRPIAEVITELQVSEFRSNFPTDWSLTEQMLTNRCASRGTVVPYGPVSITVRSRDTAQDITLQLFWRYEKEQFGNPIPHLLPAASSLKDFQELMVCKGYCPSLDPLWSTTSNDSPWALGNEKGFLPDLGPTTWHASKDNSFRAYIFTGPSGRPIGYVRIPHFIGNEQEIADFKSVISYLQYYTDALVIDQLNNPGGIDLYLYSLLSMLTDQTLQIPKQRITLTQKEIDIAFKMTSILQCIKTDKDARKAFGEDELWAIPVSHQLVRDWIEYFKLTIQEWNRGHFLTDPLYVNFIKEVKPYSGPRYKKPILVLINELGISCGDFFPAILQDNKRAILLGTKTSGAGGYVKRVSFPNHSGIAFFNYTGSIAERLHGEPIENLGVTPDIAYDLTEEDLQYEYQGFVRKIHETLEQMLQ